MQRMVFAVLAMLAAAPAAASAHAFLDKSVPPVGGTVATSPGEIRLYFTEAIEPLFSSIVVTTATGSPIPVGRATPDPSDPSQFVLKLPRLPPGRYDVHWRVVSVDTHPTEGSFSFEVGP